MSDDFDENKPEEAVSDYPEELETGEDVWRCPMCGSVECKAMTFEGEDHKMHSEYECRGCGYTETN